MLPEIRGEYYRGGEQNGNSSKVYDEKLILLLLQ